jgi:hypothetical protein
VQNLRASTLFQKASDNREIESAALPMWIKVIGGSVQCT